MRRVLRAAGVLAVVVGSMVAIGATPATANSFQFVGPNDSIQAAIDAVSPGGTVVVKGGIHAEHLVITKTVNLIGGGAVLVPPPGDAPPAPCSFGGPNTDGICVAGQFTVDDTGTVTIQSYVQGVRISGMTIKGFPGTGIDQFAGSGSTFIGNRALGNGGYGIAAFDSTGTTEIFNFASGSDEAGFYIGDSPQANAKLFANTSVDNLFGFFIRDAEQGNLTANNAHDNCIGVLFLGDAPGPVGAFTLKGNWINRNNKACPADPEEETPALSGNGLLILGAHDVVVEGNVIASNVPSGPTELSAGVGVLTGDGGTPPVNNRVRGNLILKNTLDVLWDGNGTGNVLQPNWCQTSDPAGLCH